MGKQFAIYPFHLVVRWTDLHRKVINNVKG